MLDNTRIFLYNIKCKGGAESDPEKEIRNMKVVLNKSVFSLNEKELIKQFKMEWAVPTIDDLSSVMGVVGECLHIVVQRVIEVLEIELTKNHYEPTYWVSVVAKGYDENFNEVYAEISFDYRQAVMACSGDRIDNFSQIYKKI